MNLRLLDLIRLAVVSRQDVLDGDGSFQQAVAEAGSFWGCALCLYQPGKARLLVVRSGSPDAAVRTAVSRLLAHPRIGEFELSDMDSRSRRERATARLQVDLILGEPKTVTFSSLNELTLDENRFEFGVDGLRIAHGKTVRYLLPGDCFVSSILGLAQLRRRIERLFPDVDSLEQLEFQRFRSHSWISFRDEMLMLYRGYPVLKLATNGNIFSAAMAGIDRILRTQKGDGRFQYYYDAATDSERDHEHPTRDPQTDPYYNMLRHCGGVVTLQCCAEMLQSSVVQRHLPELLRNDAAAGSISSGLPVDHCWETLCEASRKGIEYFASTVVTYSIHGAFPRSRFGLVSGRDGVPTYEAAYAVCNRKGKLGGSGVGLYMLARHQRLFGDDRYAQLSQLLARHLVGEVLESGEFMYYHTYLDQPVTPADNRSHFSFYYPGEALVGLANYCRSVCDSDAERRTIFDVMHRALRFLVVERPIQYPEQFTPLPADSWLMMAINDLWDVPEFRQSLYSDFVLQDADRMVSHMYTEQTAVFPDYIGSFFYRYGDHPYPDGARAEGLLAAYQLAVKLGDEERIERYRSALGRVIWGLLHLCNTEPSVYSVKRPELAIGGIRFKFTRQWFRVDTIQHVASCFCKYLALITGSSSVECVFAVFRLSVIFDRFLP